jgi:hypothetical protein
MKTSSAKAKGRTGQKHQTKILLECSESAGAGLTEHDIKSTPMSVSGPDQQLSQRARQLLPFDFECRNKATLNVITEYWDMSEKNTLPTIAMFKRTCRKSSQSKPPVFVISEDIFRLLIETWMRRFIE